MSYFSLENVPNAIYCNMLASGKKFKIFYCVDLYITKWLYIQIATLFYRIAIFATHRTGRSHYRHFNQMIARWWTTLGCPALNVTFWIMRAVVVRVLCVCLCPSDEGMNVVRRSLKNKVLRIFFKIDLLHRQYKQKCTKISYETVPATNFTVQVLVTEWKRTVWLIIEQTWCDSVLIMSNSFF